MLFNAKMEQFFLQQNFHIFFLQLFAVTKVKYTTYTMKLNAKLTEKTFIQCNL